MLGIRAREARHRLRGLGSHSRLKLAVVGAFAILLALGLFLLFRQGFAFLKVYPEVMARVQTLGFGLFYFSLGGMLTLSNAIIAYGVFYRGREAAFLLTTPARAEHVFACQFLEVLGYSSWAFLFLAVPLLGAFAWVEGLGLRFLAGAGFLIGCFALIPAGIGVCLAAALALTGPRRLRAGPFLGIGGLAAVGVLVAGRTLSWRRASGQLDATWLFGLMDKLAFLDHPLLPSQWLTRGTLAVASGDGARVLYEGCSLVTTAAALFALGYLLALAFHRRALARVHGATGRGCPQAAGRLDRLLEPLLGVGFSLPARLLLVKDLKTFLRDTAQWSQGLIFFGLLGIYFLNLRELAYPIGEYYWKNLIAFLNLSATCLTLATFTGRFVFPLVSLEGRRFWVLGLLPMPRRTLLWGKFWFSFLGGLLVSGSLIAVSDTMLAVPGLMALLHVFALVVICSGLSGLAVGLGAAFPSLKEDSPAKIVSGFGGTLNLVLSLAFMAAVVLLEAIPCHLYYARDLLGWPDFKRTILWCSLGVLGLGLCATLLPMRLGIRAFRCMDL